jgi:AcrR family transcriptional regulator
MSAIAATLGGSKGTLWSYFPSKEALFAAVLDHATAAFRERLSSLLDPCSDPLSTLERFAQSFVEKVTSPEAIALQRLIQSEAGRFPEVGEIFYERVPRRTQLLLADFLSSAMDRGALRRDDPLHAARIFTALCVSGSHQQMMLGLIAKPASEQLSDDVARTLDIFLRAYAPGSVDPRA